jgi:ribosomal protein L7/L12
MDFSVILFSVAALAGVAIALAVKSRANDSTVVGPGKRPSRMSGVGSIPDSTATISDPELETQIRSLVDNRKLIEAIKLIRDHRPATGLKEAKEIVDELARGGQLSLPDCHPSSAQDHVQIQPAGQGSERVLALLRQGQKIMAIKELREQTGLGLKEAKEEVDRLERGL